MEKLAKETLPAASPSSGRRSPTSSAPQHCGILPFFPPSCSSSWCSRRIRESHHAARVILIVPMCLIALDHRVSVRGMDNNILTQVGFIV
jgi:hypothetical protein